MNIAPSLRWQYQSEVRNGVERGKMIQLNGKVIRLKLAYVGMMVFLGGCVAAEVLPFNKKPVETTIVFVNAARIVIGGPAGFCVNNRQSRTTDAGAFVVLGPCVPKQASIAGLLVANISPDAGFGKISETAKLEGFFKSETGRKSLSDSDTAESVEILDLKSGNGVFYIHSRDSSDPLLPDTINEKWRGFFPVSDRMVSISLINFTDNPIPQSVVFQQLEEFSARILQLNNDDP